MVVGVGAKESPLDKSSSSVSVSGTLLRLCTLMVVEGGWMGLGIKNASCAFLLWDVSLYCYASCLAVFEVGRLTVGTWHCWWTLWALLVNL